ncbi:hypothetical protein [Algibacter sp. L4_22]|uniref:hypothetical protein n=1 Tax=Algibacter sp. L4_22 TaxID=2942477 RepID=UPI00201B657B|nr:hypothetical protein [Algibacter sp. L4_22]MCL5127262.1 hypothetical protein [Algibacter sp. L4_22]
MKAFIQFVKAKFWFFVTFVFSKGIVYLAPLILAEILTKEDFGILEYALAGLGMVVNALVSMGVPGGYPYFILRLKKLSIRNGFYLHPIWLLLLFTLNQLSFFFLSLKPELYLAFNISYIIANQVFYSTQLKSHEYSTKAIFLDSGVYLVLAIQIVLFKLNLLELSIKSINITIALYALVYGFIAIYRFYKVKKHEITFHYKSILKYSLNVMMGTFFIFLITSSGRILAEYFFTFEEVAVYSFYYRLSAVVVMIYQMISIVFFKKIYTLDPKILDKYYSLFFVGIAILSFIIFTISPFILNPLSSFFKDNYIKNKEVYFLLSSQMVMWIATALNSSIIDRENLAKKNNAFFLSLIVMSCGSLLFLKDILSLELLVLIHYSIIFIACLIQYFTLSRKSIYFKKSITVLVISYLVSLGVYLFVFK